MIKKMLNVVVVFTVLVLVLTGCNNMKFDQTTNKNNLLTEKYPISLIEELKNVADSGHMTFSKFKRDFNIQCVRKTHQGYYVVLLLEDDSNAFVFFNEEDTLIRIIISKGFKSKNEFQIQVIEQMPKSEVLSFDTNTIIAPVSAIDITAHIVQESICIVKYSRSAGGEILADPIVTSVKFFDNESIATCEDPFIRNEIPFIFEVDKVSE